MFKRSLLWSLTAVIALPGFALLIPGSPAYLPTLLSPGGSLSHNYNGHFTGHWVKALNTTDGKAKRDAIFALGVIGPEAAEGVPSLAAIVVDDPDPETRCAAGLALSKMAPASKAAVPALARALDDPEPRVRMHAVVALSPLKTEAREAIPALIQAVKDSHNRQKIPPFIPTVQEAAIQVLGRASAGTDAAVPTLREILEDPDSTEWTLMPVVHALGDVGADARVTVPKIRTLLTHSNNDLREAAETALKKIEPGATASE
jgi:HEAT repeat protein